MYFLKCGFVDFFKLSLLCLLSKLDFVSEMFTMIEKDFGASNIICEKSHFQVAEAWITEMTDESPRSHPIIIPSKMK